MPVTSYEPPDYEFQIELKPQCFEMLSGASWEVLIYSSDWQRAKNAMLIIPKFNTEEYGSYKCWLWGRMRCNLYECENLKIKFIKKFGNNFLNVKNMEMLSMLKSKYTLVYLE